MASEPIEIYCVHTHGIRCSCCDGGIDIAQEHVAVYRPGAEVEEAVCAGCWRTIARSSFVGIRTAQSFLGGPQASDNDVAGLLEALEHAYRSEPTN